MVESRVFPGFLDCWEPEFSGSITISTFIPRLSSLPCFVALALLSVFHPRGFVPLHKNPFAVIWCSRRKEQRCASSLPSVHRSSSRFPRSWLLILPLIWATLLICLPLPLDHKLHEVIVCVVFIFPVLIIIPIFLKLKIFNRGKIYIT